MLGVSLVLESHSLRVAVATLNKRATRQGMNLWTYVKTGSDPAATAIMMEDGAAVRGRGGGHFLGIPAGASFRPAKCKVLTAPPPPASVLTPRWRAS